MSLDIAKLKGKQKDIVKKATEEELSTIPEELIQFSKNKIINYCLSRKVGLKKNPSPRVLVNWVNKGLVEVAEKDRRKIKRFDKLESTWLNILVELRGFGLSLESLEQTRKILFDYVINDFSLFKFQFLNTILREPQTLVVYKDGDAKIVTTAIYNRIQNRTLPHIRLNLAEFIMPEYPNHSLEQNFFISDPFSNIEKMKLLYFLRTGDYQFMKVKLSDSDIRYIENVETLLKSDEVLKAFSEWSFENISISIDDESDTVITSKL